MDTPVDEPSARLESWVVTPRGPVRPKGTILLLHGVRMDKRSLSTVAEALSDAGYRTVLVDLRGHGESSGRFLTYGQVEARDVSTVLDDLSAHGHLLRCAGIYGFSYGGAVAVEAGARDRRITAVVAVAPFSSLREVVDDYRRKYLPEPLRWIPRAWFQAAIDEAGRIAAFDPDRSAPLNAVRASSADLLLIHGTADTQVPLRHSQALLGAARGNVRLVTVPGAEHGAMPADPSGLIRRETVAWFEHAFARASCVSGVGRGD